MWQPIETAPRDATAILVMRDIWPGTRSGRAEECNGHNTYVAAWWSDERGGQGAWICYMDAVLDPECPVEPTHWMPLPDAPGAQPAPIVPSGLHPLETVRFWADAYTHPGDDNFRGHGMAAALLREYAELRAALAAAPEAKP